MITILAILWTIAFIALQWYSKTARDSARISDMSRIKTSLELFMVEWGKYPEPTWIVPVTYSGTLTAWHQGTFWETTFRNVMRLDKVPVDPVTETEYTYSVTNTRKEYQLAWILETQDLVLAPTNQANAWDTKATARITWSYNGAILKVINWQNMTLLASPSIICSEDLTIEECINQNKLAYDGYSNLPSNFKETQFNHLWEAGSLNLVNKADIVIFDWKTSELSDDTTEWKAARKALVENLKKAYSSTKIANREGIRRLANVDINDDTAVDNLWVAVVNNKIKSGMITASKLSVDITNDTIISTWKSCSHIKINNSSATDWIYKIDPENNWTLYDVYCDMTTDWGGWTLVAFWNEEDIDWYDNTNAWKSAGNLNIDKASSQTASFKFSDTMINTIRWTNGIYRMHWERTWVPSKDYYLKSFTYNQIASSSWGSWMYDSSDFTNVIQTSTHWGRCWVWYRSWTPSIIFNHWSGWCTGSRSWDDWWTLCFDSECSANVSKNKGVKIKMFVKNLEVTPTYSDCTNTITDWYTVPDMTHWWNQALTKDVNVTWWVETFTNTFTCNDWTYQAWTESSSVICSNTYHDEVWVCTSDTKEVQCEETETPWYSRSVLWQVTINYVSWAWEYAADCAYECTDWYIWINCNETPVYNISNSLKFSRADSAYLSRTPSVAGDRTKWTWSWWVKRNSLSSNDRQVLFWWMSTATDSWWFECGFWYNSETNDSIYCTTNSKNVATTQTFKDISKWNHVLIVVDTKQAIASDRLKVFVNGVNQNMPALSIFTEGFSAGVNQASSHTIWMSPNTVAWRYFDWQMSEVNFIDWQALTASDFGVDNNWTWSPKEYTGTYWTNWFHLDFSDSSNVWKDVSVKWNDWSSGEWNPASDDITIDTPTNIFASWASAPWVATISEWGLKSVCTSSNKIVKSNFEFSTGKWYWEVYFEWESWPYSVVWVANSSKTDWHTDTNVWSYISRQNSPGWATFNRETSSTPDHSNIDLFSSWDIIMMAVDANTWTVWYWKNGTWLHSWNPSTWINARYSNLSWTLTPVVAQSIWYGSSDLIANFWQDSSFAGTKTKQNNTDDWGIGDFYYTPPAWFKALSSKNK